MFEKDLKFADYVWNVVAFDEIITKTRLFKYIENFTTKKNWKFSDKNSDIFHISAQNIDCGYLLEPSRRGGPNEYPLSMFLSRNKENNVYSFKPQFYHIKWGIRGGGQNYIGMLSLCGSISKLLYPKSCCN